MQRVRRRLVRDDQCASKIREDLAVLVAAQMLGQLGGTLIRLRDVNDGA